MINVFVKHGQTLEQLSKLKEAEKLYIAVEQPDMAIAMYKTHRKYDQVFIFHIFLIYKKVCFNLLKCVDWLK